MPPDQPLTVVAIPEGEQGLAEVFYGSEVLDPEELFFKGADKALGAAVALRFPDEGRTASDAQEAQLGLEVIAQELAAMIVPQRQPGGDLLAVGAEVGGDALPQRLEGLEAGA